MRTSPFFPDWSKDQWMVLAVLCVTHLCNGMCVSLQAPFYPAEAEKKGASATEYGLVFGIFELTVFIVSPFVGKILPKIGINRAFSGGIMTTGTMCVVFGFLNRIPKANTFIALSFIIRIIEAFGNAAFLSSSFTMVAKVFPANVSTMFGVVEMAFGVGMIIGPTVGGVLYQCGGYTLPFGVLGGILILQASLTIITLPRLKDSDSANTDNGDFGVMRAMRIPSVLLAGLSVFTGSIAVGALQATLERHLAVFSLNPMQVGMMFMLYGASYALLNPFWGWMSDKISSTLVILLGSILLGLGFFLVGPVPGLGLKPSYPLTVAAIIIAGFGLGAQLVAAFSEAQKAAVKDGFPENLATYALISSLWASTFALGAFVGPTAAGSLYDAVGFRWSTLFTVGWNVLVCLSAVTILVLRSRRRSNRSGYQEIGEKEAEQREGYTDEVSSLLTQQDSYQTL